MKKLFMKANDLISILEQRDDVLNIDFLISVFPDIVNSKNYELQFEFIDAMSRNQFYNERIFRYLEKILLGKAHYIVKLSILDYYMNIKSKLNLNEIIDTMEKLLHLRNRYIVKNQSLLNLMILTENKSYFYTLASNLEMTKDYRSHIRVYNTLIDIGFDNREMICQLVEISNRWNFGNSVKDAIKRVMGNAIN